MESCTTPKRYKKPQMVRYGPGPSNPMMSIQSDEGMGWFETTVQGDPFFVNFTPISRISMRGQEGTRAKWHTSVWVPLCLPEVDISSTQAGLNQQACDHTAGCAVQAHGPQ